MVIKGGARSGAGDLATHLQRTDTNEEMHVLELRGVVADDLEGALSDMEAVAAGARSQRPLYHASINTARHEILTVEQKHRAVEALETELGLNGQPRAVVEHVKEGRAHLHVVWLRVDLYTMEAIPDSHNYRKHELAARALEREFGHERVQGAHIERDGIDRPPRTPSPAEMLQADRSGMTPQKAKARVSDLWHQTDSGKAFAAAVEDAGFILARGDKRDFVLIDEAGETHSLGRRVDGVKAAAIRARMADLDQASLPTVDEARARQRAAGLDMAPAAAPELTAERLAGDEKEPRWRDDRENREGANAELHDAIRDLGRTDRQTADSFRSTEKPAKDLRPDLEREKPAQDPQPEKPALEAEPSAPTEREAWAERLRTLPPVSEREVWSARLRNLSHAPEQAQQPQREPEAQRPLSEGMDGAGDRPEATQRASYDPENSAEPEKTRFRAAIDAMREKLDHLADRLETAFARFRDRAADRQQDADRHDPRQRPQERREAKTINRPTDPPQPSQRPPQEQDKPKARKSAYDLLMEDVARMKEADAKRAPDHAKGRDSLKDLLKDYDRSRGREREP